MTALRLDVVGIGEDGLAGLGEAARRLVLDAELLVGGRRHLALVPETGAERLAWRSPLAASFADIEARAGRRIVVLATGDPLWYGIGRALVARYGLATVRVHPHLSAFQLACARLGWPLEEATTLSLHGRPQDLLARLLQPGRRLLALTADGKAPSAIGRLLVERGFSPSPARVLAHLGGPREAAWRGTAAMLAAAGDFPDLNLVALETVAAADARSLPLAPGLPEDAFLHDGTVTKAEVRAATLSALAPMPGLMLWDVGAGCGSIAVEWLRLEPAARAIAVEARAERATTVRANATRLGVPELAVVEGRAPEILEGLDDPDRVFLGGGVAAAGLLDYLAERLRGGGRLVANAVTVDAEAALFTFAARRGGTLRRIAVQRAETRNGHRIWRALAPVTQLVWEKR